jgi:hypothetical protein
MTTNPGPSTTRILFIGNSFTSRNQLPRLVVDLAAAAEPPLQVVAESIVAGGASLRRHWNAGIAQKALAAGEWDYVVLQEQSTLPIKNPKRYHENARLFAAEIAEHGAKTLLYLTWSRQQVPQTQTQLTSAVEAIGAEVGARVVPVGSVWHSVLQDDPRVTLYADDGSHPSAAGSYLAACTFLVSLFDQPPGGWSVSDRLKIDRHVAARLHAFAWASRSACETRDG